MLVLASFLAAALLGGRAAGDDVLPAALDDLMRPRHAPGFDVPLVLKTRPLAAAEGVGAGRSLVDLGDVSGDGAADFAAGYAAFSGGPVVEARDGRSGAPLWQARVADAAIRTLRGLAVDGDRLYVAASSPGGRVACRDAATGDLKWSLDLGGSAPLSNVLGVTLVDDQTGDGLADLLVPCGVGLEQVLLLSGGDGATVWSHALAGGAGDARPVPDQTGDGVPEVAVVGGAAEARLLSGADGSLIWSQPLDGPGSVVLGMDDANGDLVPDIVCGQFDALENLVALDGASGRRIWTSSGIARGVTSLELLDDLLGLGMRDVLVGSLDNAVAAVLALNGFAEWRREGSTVNGGSMPSARVATDINGDGKRDVYAVSVDQHVYVIGGLGGQFIAQADLQRKLTCVLPLGDGTGDGRPEIVALGNDLVSVLDGDGGTASGPVLWLAPPRTRMTPAHVTVWAYPATRLFLFAALGTASVPVPGYGIFGLDRSTLVTIHSGFAPGAGLSGFELPLFPPGMSGTEIHLQAATAYTNGLGAFSTVEHFSVP